MKMWPHNPGGRWRGDRIRGGILYNSSCVTPSPKPSLVLDRAGTSVESAAVNALFTSSVSDHPCLKCG